MINLVGIGGTGCALVGQLSQYPQYKTLEIDEDRNIEKRKGPEEYEKNCPSFKKLFKGMKGETWVMLSAAGNISGILLRVLEQLNGEKNVLCVTTDSSLLSSVGKLQQKLVVGVLQQYARSGLLERLLLVDNSRVEELMGEVPLDEYWAKINEIITYSFHSVMCFRHTKPVMETKEEKNEITRIGTLGLYGEDKKKKLFYDLAHITTERYHYSFSKQDIKGNGKILPTIKRDLSGEDNITKTFAIYESERTDPYAYLEASTHIVEGS